MEESSYPKPLVPVSFPLVLVLLLLIKQACTHAQFKTYTHHLISWQPFSSLLATTSPMRNSWEPTVPSPSLTTRHMLPGAAPDAQSCSGHIWIMFWTEHGALVLHRKLRFWTLHDFLLLTAVVLGLSVGLVSRSKLQSSLGGFLSQLILTPCLSVNSGFPQCIYELWPVSQSWFSLLSQTPLTSKTCKTGYAALE